VGHGPPRLRWLIFTLWAAFPNEPLIEHAARLRCVGAFQE
jgi:hypothetical protein